MLEEVRGKNAVIGMRRAMRLIESGGAVKVFVAGDVEPGMTRTITDACRRYCVPVETVDTRAELGKACRIDVPASVVAIGRVQ